MAITNGKAKGKGPLQTRQSLSRKRKVAPASQSQGKKFKISKKQKLSDREIIPIPVSEHDVQLSDQDMEVLETYGDTAAFLGNLDHSGIARSRKEIDRLHHLNKPTPRAPRVDDLPSIDSHDEDDDSWSSNLEEEISKSCSNDSETTSSHKDRILDNLDSDMEMSYEAAPRPRRLSWNHDQSVQRLPIKLPDGRIQRVNSNFRPALAESSDDDDDSDNDQDDLEKQTEKFTVEDISTGARFGRPAVVDVIGNQFRKVRIQAAKEEIAQICQDIVSEPENGLGLLRRLHTFSLKEISTPTHPNPVNNDIIIRKLAVLSQLAVFKDIIPGYRIRHLTDAEKAEKVSQQVTSTREWEQGLLATYQSYLRTLESELKAKTDLAEISLRCICTLAVEATHFNFSVNLMSCIVAYLSKKSWDKSSELCLKTLIQVFRSDLTGTSSLEIVRLLNRMIKERRFNIHPRVLSCLLHLRLKTELGTRTSDSKADKDKAQLHLKGRAAGRHAKGKATDQPHMSKKARKAMKEQKEIDRELRDAEAEVDKEERAATQTETLKLLFVLYFRILKNTSPTPLLPAALQGISKFAHLVNIDFFKDLMKVLKSLIARDGDEIQGVSENPKDGMDVQHRLLCIVTAFELLSGQGDALNIDLKDFVNELYAILLPLSLMPNIDLSPTSSIDTDFGGEKHQSVVSVLFRALNTVFSPRTLGSASPSWRSAAFAKRVLIASLQWPPDATLQALDFVAGLIAKDPKLEALLTTEQLGGGTYRQNIDDPQLSSPFGSPFWELYILRHHWHPKVREEAQKLATFMQ